MGRGELNLRRGKLIMSLVQKFETIVRLFQIMIMFPFGLQEGQERGALAQDSTSENCGN